MTTRQKAEIACSLFDARAIEKGMVTSKPVVDVRYDRILDDGIKLWKVQLKYAGGNSASKGSFVARLQTNYNGKIGKKAYTKDEIDILVVYLPSKRCFCWFGPEQFNHKTGLAIRTEKSKNGQSKGILWFEDFVW